MKFRAQDESGSMAQIVFEESVVDALRESEQRFRIATEAVSGVLWTNDADGEMHGPQPAWSTLTGQTQEEYSGYG